MKRLWFAAAVLAAAALLMALPAPPTVADETTVVVSRPGTVFHRAGSDDVRGRGFTKTLESALAAGYTPCSVCFAASSGKSAASPAAAGGGARTEGAGYGVPPKSVVTQTQPFGLRQPNSHRSHLEKNAVRNPWEGPDTISNPGYEQGAYASVD